MRRAYHLIFDEGVEVLEDLFDRAAQFGLVLCHIMYIDPGLGHFSCQNEVCV
jgi:hypothetical protein